MGGCFWSGFHLNNLLSAKKDVVGGLEWVKLFFRADVVGSVLLSWCWSVFFLPTCSPLDWNMCTSSKTTGYRTHNLLFFHRKIWCSPLFENTGWPREDWNLWHIHRCTRSQAEQLDFVDLDFQPGELWHAATRRNSFTFLPVSPFWHKCDIKSHNPDFACISRTNPPHICAHVDPRMCFNIRLGCLWLSWGWHHCPILCCSWYRKIFKYLNSAGGVCVVRDCCSLNIILDTHAIFQITKCELTDFGSWNTCVVLSAVVSLIIHVVLLERFL